MSVTQVIFADKETRRTLFSLECDPVQDTDKMATQLALDSTERRRGLDTYTAFIQDNSLLLKIAEKANVISFGRVRRYNRINEQTTTREKQVAELICHYLSNKQIADRLVISERTVKFHVSNLLRKFNTANRRELILELGA